jgi:outer membrane protein TolC
LRIEEERAQGRVDVASAELARLLHLDPSVSLRTPGGAITTIELVDPERPVEELVAIAERARPELSSNLAEIQRQDVQLRQARYRPLFPNLMVGFSGGAFGGTTNRVDLVKLSPNWGPLFGRTDFDVLAYWEVKGMGAGYAADVRRERAERDIAAVAFQQTRATVRREVVEAYGRVQQTYASVDIAEERLQAGERGFQEELRRIKAAEGLPIEVLDMLNLLVSAREDMIRTLVEYNTAQFELFVAIGQTPIASRVPEPSRPDGAPGPERLPAP